MRARTVMFAMGASLLMGMPAIGFAQDVASDPGTPLFETACGTCHPASQVEGEHRTKEQWTGTVDDMISRGATIADADYPAIVDYLLKYHGPTNVMVAAAPAPDSAAAVAPPAADAAAAPPAAESATPPAAAPPAQ
jgi:hypothetical protein